jgi:hypothetical protein
MQVGYEEPIFTVTTQHQQYRIIVPSWREYESWSQGLSLVAGIVVRALSLT